jgi:hypothetical protein
MLTLLSKLNSNVSIQAELDIEVNRLAFHLSVNNGEALVLVDRWKDTLSLAHHLGTDSKSFKHTFAALDTELKRIDITVYLRTRSVPILGSKANPAYFFLIKNLAPIFALK